MEAAITTLSAMGNQQDSPRSANENVVAPPFQVRNVKLDFPRFNGSNVLEWIFKAEQFFTYYNTPDAQCLTIAAVHMDSDVIPWFQMLSKNNPFQSWVRFTRALELDFGPSPYECPRSALFKLNQQAFVQDYYREFTALANRVYGVTPYALLDYFLSGLKPEIRRDVIAQDPTSMIRAVSLAKQYEEKYNPSQHTQLSNLYSKPPTTIVSQTHKTTSLPPLLPTPSSMQPNQPKKKKNSNIRNMSTTKMQLRREKGLCFTCDDKFTPLHRCPNKTYLLLHMEEEEKKVEEPEPPDDKQGTYSQNENLDHHLSFNALTGSAGMGIMKFQGTINGVAVQILLDSESSDNFIQPSLAHYLHLHVEPTYGVQVIVGDGHALTAEGFVSNMEVHIQNHTLQLPVFLLPVAGTDLVLGVAWLATLSPHILDYNALTFKFYDHGKFITLNGEKSKLPAPIQFHHITRITATNVVSKFFTMPLQLPYFSHDYALQSPAPEDPYLATFTDVIAIPRRLALRSDKDIMDTRCYFGMFPIMQFKISLGAHYISHLGAHYISHNFLFIMKHDIGSALPVVQILQSQIIIDGRRNVREILVKWASLNDVHATWAIWLPSQMNDAANTNLEDKVDFNGGGNVIYKSEAMAELKIVSHSVSKVGQLAPNNKTIKRENNKFKCNYGVRLK